MKKELSLISELAICLVIFRHVIAMITSIPSIYYATQGLGLIESTIWNFITHIAMIVILIGILKVKRWSLYAFGGLQIINVIVLSVFQGEMITHLVIALVMCAIMAGLLSFRNNGISGWNLFFASESELASEAENAVSVNETITKTDDKEE